MGAGVWVGGDARSRFRPYGTRPPIAVVRPRRGQRTMKRFVAFTGLPVNGGNRHRDEWACMHAPKMVFRTGRGSLSRDTLPSFPTVNFTSTR